MIIASAASTRWQRLCYTTRRAVRSDIARAAAGDKHSGFSLPVKDGAERSEQSGAGGRRKADMRIGALLPRRSGWGSGPSKRSEKTTALVRRGSAKRRGTSPYEPCLKVST